MRLSGSRNVGSGSSGGSSGSVIRYWCPYGMMGRSTPTSRATSGAYMPAASITTSHSTRPLSVSTAHTRPPRLRRCQPQPAELVPAGIVARQLLQLGVETDRVLHHPRQRDRRAELADEPGTVPRGAVRQLVLLDEERVRPALLREVVEDGAADHAAPDHDRPRALRDHAVEYPTF